MGSSQGGYRGFGYSYDNMYIYICIIITLVNAYILMGSSQEGIVVAFNYYGYIYNYTNLSFTILGLKYCHTYCHGDLCTHTYHTSMSTTLTIFIIFSRYDIYIYIYLLSQLLLQLHIHTLIHTHTHTHIYIYIY